MKKKDITFLAVVFIGLAGIAAGFYLTHQDTGASVEVTVNDESACDQRWKSGCDRSSLPGHTLCAPESYFKNK